MASTLLQLRSQVISEIDIDPEQKLNSSALLNRNIIRALRKVQQDTNFSLPENRATYSFVPDAQEENLPSDFVRIGSPHGVKIGDSNPLYPVDYFEILGRYNLTDSSSAPSSYYIRKNGAQWIIGFYPIPNTGETVTIPYYKKLIEMLVDGDFSPLDEDFDEAIVQYAVYLTIRRKQGFESKAANSLQSFKNTVNDVIGARTSYNESDMRVGYQRTQVYRPGPKQAGNNLYY